MAISHHEVQTGHRIATVNILRNNQVRAISTQNYDTTHREKMRRPVMLRTRQTLSGTRYQTMAIVLWG